MTAAIPGFVGKIAGEGVITADDILALRRSIWCDGAVDAAAADAIVALNERIGCARPEWNDFYVEALTSWLIEQQQPQGCIDERQAAWLTNRIGRSDGPHNRVEAELLVHCLQQAESAPPALGQFAIEIVERTVLAGDHPFLGAADVRLLRQLVLAPADRHPGSVGKAEAEMLIRIKNRTLGANNAPEWRGLFVQSVGNYLQGFSGAEPLSRAREAELAEFIHGPAVGIGDFFRRLAEAKPAVVERDGTKNVPTSRWFGRRKSLRGPGIGTVINFSGSRPLVFDANAPQPAARAAEGTVQSWLGNHIQADQQLDPLERALLDFLKFA